MRSDSSIVYIVGVDGSSTASAAAERAGVLAKALGGSVHVACAYSDERTAGTVVSAAMPSRSALANAEGIAEVQVDIYRAKGIAATWSVGEGTPADVILAEATAVGADVIAVGNKRMQGISRLLGSVANEIAHKAPCDVLIVKTV